MVPPTLSVEPVLFSVAGREAELTCKVSVVLVPVTPLVSLTVTANAYVAG